eukprot:11111314-Alexandrium_andersonii.AAC.1
MSASLVGSEMCIRDRATPWFPGIGLVISGLGPVKSLTPNRRAAQQLTPCLLYTSDAADDM